MDLRHLDLFMTTLEHGNITSAAQSLGITQPALSKQLARLEAEFGVDLLERLPRGVQPTAEGAILLDHARSIRSTYKSAVRQLSTITKTSGSEITVGAGYYWLNGLLPRAIARLIAQNPDIKICIAADVPEVLISKLLNGDLDLVFAPVAFRHGHSDAIEAESLLRTDSAILVRQGHPADDGKDRTVEELTALQWALPQGTVIRKRFTQLFEAQGLTPPDPTVEVNDVAAALDLVANSDLATMGSSVSPIGAHWHGFGRIRCKDLAGWRDSGILRRRGGVVPKVGLELCDHLRALAADHIHSVT